MNDGIMTGKKSPAKVRILYTNGSRTYNMFWLSHDGSDIYYGSTDQSGHHSYHESGKMHYRDNQTTNLDRWEIPLKDFCLHRHLITYGFINSKSYFKGQSKYKEYNGKKGNGTMIIDSRSIPDDYMVNAAIGLVSKEGMAMLGAFCAFDGSSQKTSQLIVCTEVFPWVYCILSFGANHAK